VGGIASPSGQRDSQESSNTSSMAFTTCGCGKISSVEPDLRQVRAFVAAAEHGHFGRASQSLFLTQQALSKRIAGLEAQLGVMFDRGPTGVSLTERGERFLPAAYRLLEAADHALATGLGEGPAPLRVDVWGPIDPPESTVRAFAVAHPDAIVEVSMRRNLPAALAAVSRNELDIAVGNLANFDAPLPDGLSSRLVAVTEAAALVYELGQLARADTTTTDELRGYGLAVPLQPSRQEFASFVTEYAEALGVPLSTEVRKHRPRWPGRPHLGRPGHCHPGSRRLAAASAPGTAARADPARTALPLVCRLENRHTAPAGAPPHPGIARCRRHRRSRRRRALVAGRRAGAR
jgi:DNA-binding transcriptional LysR family regulator